MDPSPTADARLPDQKQSRLEDIREVLRATQAALASAGGGDPGPGEQPLQELASLLRQAQQALQEAGALLEEQPGRPSKAILETIVDAYFCLDRDWNFTEFNAAAARLLNVMPEELVGRNIWEAYPNAVGKTFYNMYHQAVRENRPVTFEAQSDSNMGWFEVLAYPHADGLIVYYRDITRRREMEMRLQHQALVLDTVHDAIIAFDRDLRITSWNQAAEKLYGYTAEEALGMPVQELLKVELDRQQVQQVLDQLNQAGTYRAQTHHTNRRGERITIESNVIPITGESGEVSGYVAAIYDISARIQAEAEHTRLLQQLEAERTLWRTTVESMLDPVTTSDWRGQATYMNPAYSRLIDLDIQTELELEDHPSHYRIERPDGKPIDPRDLPLQKAALEDTPVFGVELVQYGKNGEKYSLVWNAAPLHAADGTVIGAVAVGRDITAQRHTEAERDRLFAENQLQKDLLEKIIEVDPGGIAVVAGPNLEFQMVNPAYQALTPYPNQNVLGRPFDQVWPAKHDFIGAATIRRVIDYGKRARKDQVSSQFPNGAKRFFSYHIRRIYWKDTPAALITIWDTTRIEHATEEARRRADELDSIINSMIEGVSIYDSSGRLVKANPALIQAYGFDPIGMRQKEISERIAATLPDGSPIEEQNLVASRASRGEVMSQTVPRVFTDASGRRKHFMVSGSPVRMGDEAAGAVVIWHDITPLIEAEEKLRDYARQLEKSNRELEEFAFIASHDLQEPLRKIETFGEMLHSSQWIDAQQRDYLDRMVSAANRLRQMIQDLLTLSRITTKEKLEQPVKLSDLIREILIDLEIQIRTSGAQVESADLPVVAGDPGQMRQLFQNLISNAIKFHQPEVAPQVHISASYPSPGTVQISIRDKGIGFDMRHADHLFQPFHRLVNRSEYEGTGMGLAICKKIVERHNGSLTAQSQPGEGTTFTVTLPALNMRRPPMA